MSTAKISLAGLALTALVAFPGQSFPQAAPTAPATQPAAGDWYSVALSDSEEAFVKTSSIKAVGTQLQVRVKENFLTPRPAAKKGKSYQSTRTDYRVECATRKIAMFETKAFSGTDLQGEEVQKASRNERNLIWMDAPRASVFGEILDYTCKKGPQQAPAG